jgi:Mn2+/Fe2+ NRAMP family transporter
VSELNASVGPDVSNDRKVMGERVNGRLLSAVGWATALVMGVASIALIATTIFG